MSFSPGHALLIGVGSYIHHAAVTNLPNTVEDVRRLAALLTDPQYCGYPAAQVTVLHDDQATRDGVLAALDHLVTTTTADSTVLIYYAGHGHYDAPADAADRAYYLTTHETALTPAPPATTPATLDPERWIVPDTAISQAELLAALQRLPAQRVVLLFNACHAGELHPTMSLGAAPVPVLSGSNPPEPLAAALLGTGSGRVIITACRDSQVSQSGPGPTTIFAEYLLAALQGQDVPNRDGTISVFDLYLAVYEKVKARVLDRHYQHQEPVLTMLRGVGPFPVALHQGATSMGITDAAAPPAGDAVRLISIQQSQQALSTLLSRMDQKLDQLGRQFERFARPAPPPPDPRILAQAVLDTMPLDTVPEPAPFPPFSRMPYAANPHFVGRDDALLALAQALKGGGRVALGPRAAATGLGGIGKTSVAAEFVHRYGQYFAGGVFWLSFADPAAIAGEVAACGGPGLLNLSLGFGDLKQDEQVALVTAAWRQETPRLLIFDNCEDPTLVESWAPPTGGCRVLITSRRQRWPSGLRVQTQRLAVLARTSSIALLQQLAPRLTDAEADSLATELGDLPLALQLAGSYLAQFERTRVSTYLTELTSAAIIDHASLEGQHDEDVSLTAHDRHVGRTFLVSYQHLDPATPTDALAMKLLARAACLAPGEPIPLDLLCATAGLDGEARDGQAAWQRLVNLGFLTSEVDDAVQLHRLIHAFVGTVIQDENALTDVEHVVLERASAINADGYPSAMRFFLAHLNRLIRMESAREDAGMATLCMTLGVYLESIGDDSAARPLVEWALAIREQILGPNHPDTATSLSTLARLVDATGNYTQARMLVERALAIREQELGPSHPDTAESLTDLALMLQAIGNYGEAWLLIERALAIYEQELGPNHPATAKGLNDMAYLLKGIGDYSSAQPLLERALAITEQMLGPNHPTTAQSLNNLAYALYATGDYTRAQQLLERALAIFEQELEPDHPDTVTVRANLADLNAVAQAQGASGDAQERPADGSTAKSGHEGVSK